MDEELMEAFDRNPHLREYIEEFQEETGTLPEFHSKLSRDMGDQSYPNILYPVGDPIFIHIHGQPEEQKTEYIAVEPRLSEEEQEKYDEIMDKVLEKAPSRAIPENDDELRELMYELFAESTTIVDASETSAGGGGLLGQVNSKVEITQREHDKILYFMERDIVGSGPIEPVIRDPYLEDIHGIGVDGIFIVHKIFDMLPTNLSFGSRLRLEDWMRSMSERIGRPVSEGKPISDGALPDGSRINLIFSDDVSRRGSSFTMRKFTDVPLSITQLIEFKSISSEIAAYMWICLENGMSVFFSGETASGKTTMLNACLPFIDRNSKVYSAEDTAEVQPPQPVWQQLITREEGPEESRVDLFTLLKAALRSRPNYIIVGEIRGVEGAVAFQAMQTGHPVVATFHASSVRKMIQRLTGDPINVPVTFIDNLNVAMILMAVYRKGDFLRRCIAIEEIEGYFEDAGGVVTRPVFQWDPSQDKHDFRGYNNSFILENKIAEKLGYEDKRQIYEDLFLRAKVLDKMIEHGITEYYDVLDVIWSFQEKGVEGLPFGV